MISRGVVNQRGEATLPIHLIGPIGASAVMAVVDTGFTGSLTMPVRLVTQLGLMVSSRGSAFLADGSEAEFDVYTVDIDWNGGRRQILVSCVGAEVLIGMKLLTGHELRAEITPGGIVEVKPLT